jgi:hypothetical protein
MTSKTLKDENYTPGLLPKDSNILPSNFLYPVQDHVAEKSIIFDCLDMMAKRFNTAFPMLMGKDSPLFNPDPFSPLTSYKQKNRHYWSEEDIKKLSMDNFGFDCFDPEGIRIVICPYEHTFNLYNAQGELRDDYYIGRVIKIGKQAFSTEKFIAGPPCTFNDFVHFKSMNVLTSKPMNGKVVCVVEDVAILGLIEDPAQYYKTKDFDESNMRGIELQIKELDQLEKYRG